MLEVCIILSSTCWRCDAAWRWWYAGFELDGVGRENPPLAPFTPLFSVKNIKR